MSEVWPVSSTSMTIQIGDSSRMMLGSMLDLKENPTNQDQLAPGLAEIPVLYVFFGGTDNEVRTSNLITAPNQGLDSGLGW